MLTDSPCSCLPDSFPPRTRLSPGASCTMAGETQRPYAIKDLDVQDVGTPLVQQSDRHAHAPSEHFPSTGTDSLGRGASREKLEKERDATQQREAVIRPQQAGKIDFSSLQNRATFAMDRTWSNGKGSPQSPSGKSRGREKGKRSGKSERGSPQQLYRLSIANPRSNPNIGIAYPQQKVSPPKKQEAGRGPVTGSYRFHVPSVPEREAELQHEELSYSRCFQEPSNLTSPSYTSQALGSAGGTAPQQPALSQQPDSMESSGAQPGSQLLLTDFQLSGSNAWQSPEHIFNGANYGLSSQKTTALTEAGKPNAFVPVQFQFGYQFLEDSTSDTYSGEQNPQTQDFADSSLRSVHVNHTSFGFTSGEGQEGVQSNAQYSSDQLSEDRTSYPQHPQPSQYIPTPQGAASSMHCLRTLSEDSASSDSSGSSSQQSDQGKSALPESTEAFGQVDNTNSKKSCHTKETAANQRTIIQGNVHHSRNIAQGSNSQMHFPNKTYHGSPHSTIHVGSVPFEKNIKVHNRGPHCWEGSTKTYSTVDQNAIPYTDMNDKYHFQNQQSLDQRPNSSKNSHISWQQLRLTSAVPNQNKVELSRPLSNQKQTYMVSPSDWQDDHVKSQKNAPLKSLSALQNNRPSEGFPTQRQETVKHSSKTISSFKVEMSHAHVCESKNKPVYFGMNQSLPGASSRNYNYQPLQVPPTGLMMVSPYESPSPSPLHNPTSSSTCSSLSPTSTSPVNLSSEEGQTPKAPLYHQQQAKAQLAVDHLNTNPHHFHSDGPRHSPYAPDRAKDDMLSYLQSNGHPKMSMDGNKCYMDSLGVDHHQPPPSYSAHQLLASSLATANLDQLDVLLTCKQCDQNFNNVASFLGHKQYCAQHSFAQNDLKDLSKMEGNRKFPAELSKASLSGPSCLSMSRCPSDLHLSLLGLNKNGELMSDSEAKGDAKEDPMKLNMFSGPGILPVPLPDLEMDGLDSLITEALNGLGYQSDNADIDSSFIDAFADDDLTTVKQSLKTKESKVFESKSKVASDDDRSLAQGKYIYDSDLGSPKTAKHFTDRKSEKISLNLIKGEKINIKKEVTHKNPRFASGGKSRKQDVKVRETRKLCKPEDENTGSSRFCLSTKFSEHCGVKSLPDNSTLTVTTPAQVSNTSQTSPTIRTPFKENKRKRTGGGSWSKELIHKIVQQKNKLHKLHVKGTKNLQFSLVMERLTPTVQNPAFGEYDYVSDSDDECEPVKIASQGRLSQSSRCKYTYTKECKWRARSERDQAAWRHESKECFAVKKSEEVSLSPEKPGSHQRLGRRGSRSSTSSELSTSVSISGDSINSPKSTDHTDSDCEKRMEIKRKESPEPRTYGRPSSQKMSTQLALTFTKSTKKYNADKHTLSTSKEKTTKEYHSNSEDADHASSPPKAKGALINLDKCRTTHRTSREKLELFSQEIGTLSSTGINSSHAIDNTSSKEESLQSAISNIKKPHLDNESVFASKVTESPTKNVRNSKGKFMLKRRAQAEGQPSQTNFSEIAALEKQTDGVSLVKEAVCLIPNIPMCNSLIEEVCLSPTATDGQLLQKDPSHLIPFPLDQEQGLMKSPLSFDASSVFGDLTVAGFGSGLYSDMSLQKEGFNTDNTTDKKEGFVSSFSPFLEQRDWGLMDVSTVLPDEIAQYKGNSEKSNEKKPDFNHVPLSLPEKIMDYSTNLNSCAEDELEIKRIVNELENQLQTTKLQNSPLLAEETPQQLQMSKFSPLRLGDESENEGNSVDIGYPVQAIEITDVAEHFTEPTLPWSSPFQFELMAEHHSPQSPTHHHPGIPEQFPEKDDNTANTESAVTCEAHLEQNPEEIHVEKGAPTETKEEMLEQKRYAEDIMKSLEVISDSIFEKQSIISEQEVNVTNLDTQQHLEIERQSTDAVVRAVDGKEEGINKENIPLPPNINEGKDDITLILESQPSLSNSTELTVDAKQPIILHLSEHEENNHQAETKVHSLEDNITDNVNGSAFCLNMEMDVLHMAEVNGRNAHVEDNINVQFTNNTDVLQHSTTISAHEEEVNAITSQQESCHSPPTPPKTTLVKGNHMDMVQPGWIEDPAYIHNNAEDVCSSLADKRKEDSSANIIKEGENPVSTLKQEGFIEYAAPQQYSAPEIYCTSQTSGMEVVATELPCSPILMEPDMDCSTLSFQRAHAAVGESSRLTSSQSSDILQFGVGTACLFKNKCESKMGLAPDIHHNQETDIPDVKNIGEQPPVNLIASCQSSPCGNVMDLEESNHLILNAVPQNSPPHSPIEKLVIQNNQFHSQSKSTDITFSQTSLINALSSPRNDHQNVNEALHIDEPLSTEITYSLISPPQQDLGITDCKSQSTANVSSPLLMASIAAEQPETSESFPKKDTLYCFKLSPLNYSGILNDPPQLSQYDYIPISPAYKAEEKSDIKQTSSNVSDPCDLSVDPGLIFNHKTMVTNTDHPFNSIVPAKHSLPDEPMKMSSIKESPKFALAFQSQGESTDNLTVSYKNDLEACHNPPEASEYFNMPGDLLETVEKENGGVSEDTFLPDSALFRRDIPDCENKQMSLPSAAMGKTPIEISQSSTANQVQEEILPKKSAQHSSQQGKALCEICAMCFRTVPGLKRHKAMKHLVRTDIQTVQENATSTHQGTMPIYDASQTTEKGNKDESQAGFQRQLNRMAESRCVEKRKETLTNKSSEIKSVLDNVRQTETLIPSAVVDAGNYPPPLQTKANKNKKFRNNKNTNVNIKPDNFSDEILNILKTEMLQAITPEFQNCGAQEQCNSPEVKEKIHLNKNITDAEDLPIIVASKNDIEQVTTSLLTETNVSREVMVFKQNNLDSEELKCMAEMGSGEDICADKSKDCVLSKNEDTSGECNELNNELYAGEVMLEEKECLTKEMLRNMSVEIKCENKNGQPDIVNHSPLSPPGMSPDLKALLDDDTFSQLFPRDEEIKRKKCQRVYSKKNKRQKLSPDPHLDQDLSPANVLLPNKEQYSEKQGDDKLSNNKNNHCEYDTISIDDAIMLNMCHNSTLNSDANVISDIKQGANDHEDINENHEELSSNVLSPIENNVDKSLITWSGSCEPSSFIVDAVGTAVPSSCKTEVPPSPCPLPLTSTPYSVEPCVSDNVTNFHSIDIQNINTTFQLPEIQFFDSSKDITVAPPISSVDNENKDVEKSKKQSEHRGRKRQDGSMKAKDKQYKCKVCFTWFLTLGELNFHKLSHNPSPPPTCYMCVQRKFSSREQLRDHLREKHAKNKAGIWTCGMCLKEISDVWMYNEHLREHATQFARKGQTQGSMLGIPGSLMQETAVKNFITSIMQHRPSKTIRESSKTSKEQEKLETTGGTSGECKTTEVSSPKGNKTKSSNGTSGKQGRLPPLEILHKTETPKNVEMHPNCKDPSRDCHHCGKQFPKPFKLQRHLVVHNLEKIFLCNKCPVSYQEAQELKDHLKRVHEEVDELDSKHTTLYTCELCADVMHVIKKSFICSTCNYTFSKKEQFDRHMEKHLSGGNKIFKFRSVLRPVKAPISKEECDFPASKKRIILNDSLQDNSSDSGIASIGSLHLSHNPEMTSKPTVSTADDSTQTSANEYYNDAQSANVKTENIAEEYSDLLVELEQCAFNIGSSEATTPKKEEKGLNPSLKKPEKEDYVKSVTETCVKKEDETVCIRLQTTTQCSFSKVNTKVGEEKVKGKPGSECSTGEQENRSEKMPVVPPNGESLSNIIENQMTKTLGSEKLKLDAGVIEKQGQNSTLNKSNTIRQDTFTNSAEKQGSCQLKDKLPPYKTSDGTKSCMTRATDPPLISKSSIHSSVLVEERVSLKLQKKMKDVKASHSLLRGPYPETRENLCTDPRVNKKFRAGICHSLQRKSDGPCEYPVLSSVRDEVVSNKIVTKYKTKNMGMPPKRRLLDNYTPKKAEIVRQINGDYNSKKGSLGRPLHSPVSKVSTPMNNSLNKTKMGVRSMERHSYRTAESQNNLLSQLFGQKLTSFKIPLRKDTSESIN